MTDKLPDNPLLKIWKTPFDLPPFAAIEPAHYRDGFDAAMAAHKDEIAAIAEQAVPPSFANTIEALELAGEDLTKVAATFFNVSAADTNDDLQAVERDMAPRLARHNSAIVMNAALFERIDLLFRRRDALDLSSEAKRLLEKTHERFVRAGAALTGDARTRMAEIAARLAELGTQFAQNVLADEKDYELVLELADMSGCPAFLISAAQAAAAERGHEDKCVITLSRSLIEPFLTFSTRRDLRAEAFAAWTARGRRGGATDNTALISEILQLRQERAELLGFDNFSHFKLDNQMAGTPERVRALLEDVWSPAVARAREEAAALADLALSEGSNEAIAPHDWRHYAEKLRLRDHALNEEEIKPYFQLNQMIEAAFAAANRLFGVWFRELDEIETYHPDVRVWEVKDGAGQHIGLFLGDYFARPSKRSGAWMSGFRSQQKLKGNVRPIIVNVMNFAKAPDGEPCLLTFDDAHTLFHEFGHALHGLLSNVTYPSLAGTSVARDFVELPSQLFEHWLTTPQILKTYATHADTGAPIPDALMERLLAARSFNQGFATVEYLASALVDLAVHENAQEAAADPLGFEARVLKAIGLPEEITMRHASPHFLHIFSGDGYSAGYYAYMWSEVMDADAFVGFEETGDVFEPALARKLKDMIYSAGNSADPVDLYTAFRGRMPDITALLEKRGLQSAL